MALLRHALRALRGQVLAYGLGLVMWGVIEALLFPTVRDTLGAVDYPKEILEAFGASGGNLANPRTFMDVEFFSLGPLVMATFALLAGSGALGGEESGGTMEVLASLPMSRRRMFASKVGAVLLAMALACVMISIGWALAAPFADFGRELSIARLVLATFGILPFTAFMVVSSVLLAAIAPSRGAAGAWSGVLLVASYLLVVIANVTDSVENLRYASPYYYSDLTGILQNGVEWKHQLVLASSTIAVGWVALRAFEGRELGAERWQFAAPFRGGPTMFAPDRPSQAERTLGWLRERRGRWWAGAATAVVLVGAASGATAGALLGSAAGTRTVSASGWVMAPSARVVAPVSGALRSLAVAEGADVVAGQDIGWVQNALDGSLVPLRAPIAGRIAELKAREGEFVAVGTPMATVHQLDALYVQLEVDERDIEAVVPGQPLEARVSARGLTLQSTVVSVGRVPLAGDGVRSRDEPKYEVKSAPLAADAGVTVGMVVDGLVTVTAAR